MIKELNFANNTVISYQRDLAMYMEYLAKFCLAISIELAIICFSYSLIFITKTSFLIDRNNLSGETFASSTLKIGSVEESATFYYNLSIEFLS